MLYCTNCDNTGHPASYKGCPFYKFAQSIKENSITQKRINKTDRLNHINEFVQKISPINTQSLSHSKNLNHTNPTANFTSHINTYSNNSHNKESSPFINSSNINFDFNNFLLEIKSQINLTIDNKLTCIFNTLETNTSRINNIYEHLNLKFD